VGLDMTHDELRELATSYALDTATRRERGLFEAHLAECDECRRETMSFEPVVQGLAFAAPLQEPRRGLRAEVLERATGRSAKAGGTVARPGTWPGWMAAAAATVLVGVVGAYAINVRNRMETLEAELREATTAVARVNAEVADLQRTAAEQQMALLILGASDLARIDLRAEPAVPNARARAFWNRASGLVFTASDLPAVPEGKAYQLWVLTAGAPVSAGLIQPDARGVVDLVIQTPLDLPAPTGMAVTVEPAGGVPSPTGERVLLGLVAG
jgi:anti-sigma-K factor RskA